MRPGTAGNCSTVAAKAPFMLKCNRPATAGHFSIDKCIAARERLVGAFTLMTGRCLIDLFGHQHAMQRMVD